MTDLRNRRTNAARAWSVAGAASLCILICAALGAAASAVTVVLTPATVIVSPMNTFGVEVMLRTGSQPVDGVQVYLTYDPAVLQVLSATPDATALPIEILPPAWDNATGALAYAAGILSEPAPSGDLRVLTIRFRALSPHPGSTIAFATADPARTTKVSYSGAILAANLTPSVVTVVSATPTPTSTPPTTTATVSGRVVLQGRSDHSGALVCVGGLSTTTDASGVYALSPVPGSYGVTVSLGGYLSATCPGVVARAGATTQLTEVTLLAGDVDGDCQIGLFDLVVLGARFNQLPPAPPPHLDLNADGALNILDVVLLAGNYGRFCPNPWACP